MREGRYYLAKVLGEEGPDVAYHARNIVCGILVELAVICVVPYADKRL